MREKTRQAFRDRFQEEPHFIVRAPARVNLIGEHTDYNDGFAMPLAIERSTWLAGRKRADGRVLLESADFGGREEVNLADVEININSCSASPRSAKTGAKSWGEYLRGVAWALGSHFERLQGWEGVSLSDIPIASGLSSSASFELAIAGAFAAAADLQWDARRMSLLCKKAEVEWIGVNCGMMDYIASAEGRKNHALLIDCRSLEMRPVPMPRGLVLVVLDTAKARTLADSAYNERRAQCDQAARSLGVASLRDASLQLLEVMSKRLDPVIARRARHVISENERTLKAARAMKSGDGAGLGKAMANSHASLRDDYEVSCRELDVMVECAQTANGCIGARMTGAGFGGCAVALVAEGAVEPFSAEVAAAYEAATGLAPKLYPSRATNGLEIYR